MIKPFVTDTDDDIVVLVAPPRDIYSVVFDAPQTAAGPETPPVRLIQCTLSSICFYFIAFTNP